MPLDADIAAVLHGMKDFAEADGGPVARMAGGRWQLEIQSARIAQGEALANGDRHAGADAGGPARRRDAGQCCGDGEIFPAIARQKGAPLSLDRAAPALNAIDRAVPGLGARLAPQAQSVARLDCWGCSGSRSRSRASAVSRVPVRFKDGSASFGPIPLGQVPPVF